MLPGIQYALALEAQSDFKKKAKQNPSGSLKK